MNPPPGHIRVAPGGDLPGCARGFPVPAEEVLSIGVDQVREVLVRNTLRGPPGRTFLRHSERILRSWEGRRTHSKVRDMAKHIEIRRETLFRVSNNFLKQVKNKKPPFQRF